MQQTLKTRWMVAVLALAGVTATQILLPADANAAAKYVGRMSIEVQEGHPKQIAMERFAKLVSERINQFQSERTRLARIVDTQSNTIILHR